MAKCRNFMEHVETMKMLYGKVNEFRWKREEYGKVKNLHGNNGKSEDFKWKKKE